MASSEPISDIFYDRMLWHHEDQTNPPTYEDDSDYLHGEPFDDHE